MKYLNCSSALSGRIPLLILNIKIIHSFLWLTLILVGLPACSCPLELTSNTSARELANAKKVEVKENVDLGGSRLVLSDDAILIFNGGAISNGEVVLNNTELNGEVKLFCHITGSIKNKNLFVDWFLPENDLDVLYRNGFYSLKGYEEILFQKPLYIISVRGKNEGICISNVTIDGRGATIYAKEGGKTTNSMFVFTECKNIKIKNLVLKGSAVQGTEEGARHNLCLSRCTSVVVENVVSRDAFTDGLYIRKCDDVRISRFTSYHAGRQGCSITAGTNIYFDRCLFDGSYRVTPKSGFDIEANYTTDDIDNIVIKNCRFTNNAAAGLTIKLRTAETTRLCNISVEKCVFEGNAVNITVGAAPNSGGGVIDVRNCILRNSRGVSFQSKCYSALGTPLVKFHDSTIENANLSGGKDVREHATLISVHNVSSRPLQSDYGHLRMYNLILRQTSDLSNKIQRAVNIYPDSKWSVSDIDISNIRYEIDRVEDKTFRRLFVPKSKMKRVKIR